MRYDIVLIGVGVLCLLGGELLGLWMASHQDFTLAPAHAHTNLVGWVTLSLYGLAHRVYPAMSASKLAGAQAIVAIVAAVALPFTMGYMLLGGTDLPAIMNALLITLGTLLFAIMFFRHAGKAA